MIKGNQQNAKIDSRAFKHKGSAGKLETNNMFRKQKTIGSEKDKSDHLETRSNRKVKKIPSRGRN
jgi:hypothetical protein